MIPLRGCWYDRVLDGLRRACPGCAYSHATEVDGWVFLTGQIPTDPNDDSAPLPEGIEAQTHRVIESLQGVLAGVGSALDQVVSARVYLTHFERDYAAMNGVYQSYFAAGRLPARTCIGVTALARGALVEIDLLARKGRAELVEDGAAGMR